MPVVLCVLARDAGPVGLPKTSKGHVKALVRLPFWPDLWCSLLVISLQLLSQEVHRLQQALREEQGRLQGARQRVAAIQRER